MLFRSQVLLDLPGLLVALFVDGDADLAAGAGHGLALDAGDLAFDVEEGNEKSGQIQEYLDKYHGEGIQHIALGSSNLPATVDAMRASGVALLDTIDTYYELVDKRIPGHGEDVAELKQRKILIDGKAGELLLQIFSENQLGPIFFEFIQRKGDQGFGEGNFKALFESIELDQMRRGVLEKQ